MRDILPYLVALALKAIKTLCGNCVVGLDTVHAGNLPSEGGSIVRDCDQLCEAVLKTLRQTRPMLCRTVAHLYQLALLRASGIEIPMTSEQCDLVSELFIDDRPHGFRQLSEENPSGRATPPRQRMISIHVDTFHIRHA